jgi:mersacidin/lichenicidin family type 2 lantibiotic
MKRSGKNTRRKQERVPANPAGVTALTDQDLAQVQGGGMADDYATYGASKSQEQVDHHPFIQYIQKG